jgi:hypothetical protein
MRSQLRVDRLPRMADFALWGAACETAIWPPGTFARAYAANRRAAVEDAIDADPLAARVRELMTERSSWIGSAADLLRIGADRSNDGIAQGSTGWPKSPRALSGRLRRAQPFLRALGIEVVFSREGRTGSRVIRIHRAPDATVSIVSSDLHYDTKVSPRQPLPAPSASVGDLLHRSGRET